jgi:hypothetical protein
LLGEGLETKKKMTENERKVGEALVYILDSGKISLKI